MHKSNFNHNLKSNKVYCRADSETGQSVNNSRFPFKCDKTFAIVRNVDDKNKQFTYIFQRKQCAKAK